jgi:predicted Zn-dependent protease
LDLNLPTYGISRRQFLYFSSLSAISLSLGCAFNPVTGKKQLMLISESEEIDLDRENSPHQFSSDYGASQNQSLQSYIASVGKPIAAGTHRPNMPYRFVIVNAAYINAYTFPGGSVGITRGILLDLESEAELSSLIGHELGHVNARHTAQRMTKSVLTSLAVASVSAYTGSENEKYQAIAAGLGSIAAGALLAHYSRDNEREADSLGMDYMIKAGYNPGGQTDLMDMLRSMSKKKPNAIEMMFSTHPMGEERYQSSLSKIASMPGHTNALPYHRERYMDNTAGLRAIAKAIDEMQNGDKLMMGSKFGEAKKHYGEALRIAPGDYAGLLMMAKCQIAMEDYSLARRYAEDAATVYPEEAQALHILGIANLKLEKYDEAFSNFERYEQILPGNPNTVFFKGLSLEKMGKRDRAASEYIAYLNKVQSGQYAEYAYNRLVEWGYVKKQ